MPKYKVTERKITDYIPDSSNANEGSVRGLAMLEDSLAQDGVGRSIVADAKDRIPAGNKTQEAAINTGIEDVIEIETDGNAIIVHKRRDWDLDDPEGAARRYAYRDNRTSEVSLTWNAEQLLADLNAGVDLSQFWREDELQALLESIMPSDPPADAGAQVDKAAELQAVWNVQRGDLWTIGKHRLLCGDSTNADDVARVMGGERADAVVTDSPYGIEREGIENDNEAGLADLFDGVLSALPVDNAVIINFQSPRLFPVWLDAIRQHGHKFERALWFYDETDVTFPWRGWLMCSQIALVSSAGKPQWAENKYSHDCYLVKTAGQQDDSGGHTTAKPLDVVRDLAEHTTGLVYDPFGGSGTTMVACEQLGRQCRMIEISEPYCAVILQRMSDMGLTPTRE